MKRYYIFAVAFLLLLSGCSKPPPSVSKIGTIISASPENFTVTLTDSTGAEVTVMTNPKKVVALSASLAQIWLQAGGSIIGTTGDALEEGRLDTALIDSDIQNIGTIKDPSAELILSLNPDLVILSPTIAGHKSAAAILQETGIPFYYADADSFNDYLDVYKDFTELTGRSDLYESLGVSQKTAIEQTLAAMPEGENPTVLILRAFSSGVKAKADGTVLTNILDDFGVVNIASDDNAMLESLSLEKVVEDNPDYIFIVYMGDESEETEQYLKENLYNDPVWATLAAVRERRVFIMPQDLFHYKPNDRWAEAYAYLLNILESA